MTTPLRIAAIQARPVSEAFDDIWSGGDVERAVALLETAARAGATCACLPELYPRVGEAEMCAAARRLGLFVVAGLIDGTRARWLNTATVIGPDGRLLGRQPKCFPTQGEIDGGAIPGEEYRVIETEIGRLGIVICADFAFSTTGAEALMDQGADIIFNPSWWFALGEAYPATVIGRHLQYGKPVIGVDIAACSLRLRDAAGRLVERFPRAGGYSTVCVPPAITTLAELAEWFRTKPGGTNSAQGFIESLGEEEGILYADVDIEAVRRFPGYFYRAEPVLHSQAPSGRSEGSGAARAGALADAKDPASTLGREALLDSP
jgi:predicted amidohydrolase